MDDFFKFTFTYIVRELGRVIRHVIQEDDNSLLSDWNDAITYDAIDVMRDLTQENDLVEFAKFYAYYYAFEMLQSLSDTDEGLSPKRFALWESCLARVNDYNDLRRNTCSQLDPLYGTELTWDAVDAAVLAAEINANAAESAANDAEDQKDIAVAETRPNPTTATAASEARRFATDAATAASDAEANANIANVAVGSHAASFATEFAKNARSHAIAARVSMIQAAEANHVKIITHHVLRKVIQYKHHFVHSRVLHVNSSKVPREKGGQTVNTTPVYIDNVSEPTAEVVDLEWNGSAWQLPTDQSFIPADFVIEGDQAYTLNAENNADPELIITKGDEINLPSLSVDINTIKTTTETPDN